MICVCPDITLCIAHIACISIMQELTDGGEMLATKTSAPAQTILATH
jgi:hypothetical protein